MLCWYELLFIPVCTNRFHSYKRVPYFYSIFIHIVDGIIMFSPSWFFDVKDDVYVENPEKYFSQNCAQLGIMLQSVSHRINITLTFQLALHHALQGDRVMFFCNRMEMYNSPPCFAKPHTQIGDMALSRIMFHYPQTFEEVQSLMLSYLDCGATDLENIPSLFVFETLELLPSLTDQSSQNLPPRMLPSMAAMVETITLINHVVTSLRMRSEHKMPYFVVCDKVQSDIPCGSDFLQYDSPLSHLPCITHVATVRMQTNLPASILQDWRTPCKEHSMDFGIGDITKFVESGHKIYSLIFHRVRQGSWKYNACSEHLLNYRAMFILDTRFECIMQCVPK